MRLPPGAPKDGRAQRSENFAGVGARRVGSIYIEFIPQSEWPVTDDSSVIGNTQSQVIARREEVVEARSSRILIDSRDVRNFSEEKIVYIIVHELLHALGFSGHTDPGRFPDATLNPNIPANLPLFLLSPIDREAMLAAYGRLKPSALPEEISIQSLIPWDDASFHIRGDMEIPGGAVSFGVAFRNGLAQSWASGPEPPMDLVQNGRLSGTITWSGTLLGITPSGEVVAGDSNLEVNLTNLGGATGLHRYAV